MGVAAGTLLRMVLFLILFHPSIFMGFFGFFGKGLVSGSSSGELSSSLFLLLNFLLEGALLSVGYLNEEVLCCLGFS